jgi:S1-C subfamily serine protease
MLVAVGVNLGFLNWKNMEHWERMNRIEIVYGMRDQMLYQGVNYVAQRLEQHENWLPRLVAEKMPSVVAIHMEHATQMDPFTGQPVKASAAGVVIDDQGAILTASHVIDQGWHKNSSRFWVEFADGTTRDIHRLAYVAGRDPDIGVVYIDPNGLDLQPVGLDLGATVAVGDRAVVIGSPHSLDHTVTVGVVSAIREIRNPSGPMYLHVQIDAPINGGNSGGPVFNERGEMIGIVSWTYPANSLSFIVSLPEVGRGMAKLCEPIDVVLYGEQE